MGVIPHTVSRLRKRVLSRARETGRVVTGERGGEEEVEMKGEWERIC